MANSFADLQRNSKTELESLTTQMDKLDGGNNNTDERKWRPTADKAGTGSAIIRFLCPSKGEDLPFIRYWDHAFQGPGGWYIEKSLTSLDGADDPVSVYNSELWNTGLEENQEIARKQKRRLHYVSNILVIDDPANPENNGKVFLYEYGKKIFDKIKKAMKPDFDDEEPINAFNLWEGANFRLRFYKADSGFRTYEDSKFDSKAPVAEDDAAIEKIYNQLYPLQPILDPANFKSYAELEARLYRVLKLDGRVEQPKVDESETVPAENPLTEEVPDNTIDGTDNDDLAFFESLANDDK